MPTFHLLPQYRKIQSEITERNWKTGKYNFHIRKLETRRCKNKDCRKTFMAKPYDPKIFCSRSCAAYVNNTGRRLSREIKLKIANSLSSIPVKVLKSEMPKKSKDFLHPFVVSRAELKKLYCGKRLSSGEIASKFGVTNHQVIKKMKKYNIPRRTASESNHIKYLKQPPTYNFKKGLTLKERLLYNSAVMLYWAEGAKAQQTCVNFANSDENMAKLFLKTLRQVFRIDESRLRVNLYCYANQNVEKLKVYWSKLLQVPLNKFIKPYVRQDFDRRKRGKMPHGLVHIVYHDKKLLTQIMSEIDIISRQLVR